MSADVPSDPGASPEPDESRASQTLDEAVERLTEAVVGLQRLLDIGIARTRIELRERVFRAFGWMLLSVLLLTMTVAATLYALRGIAGLLSSLFTQTTWAGDLATGAAGLLLALLVGLQMRARFRRRGLKRLRERFGKAAPHDREA